MPPPKPELVPEPWLPEVPPPKLPRGPSAVSRALRRVRREARSIALVVRTNAREYAGRPTQRALAISLPRWLDAVVLALMALVAASLVANGFGAAAHPEASAVYLASRLAAGAKALGGAPSGAWPGEVALLTLFALVQLSGWAAAQALAATSFAATAILAFLTARASGRVARLVAPAAMLFAYEPLVHATRPTATTFAMPLVAGALFALVRRRARLAAALGALASLACPAAFPVALVLLALVPEGESRVRPRTVVVFGAALVLGLGLLVALTGTHAFADSIRLFFSAPMPGSRLRLEALAESSGGWLALAFVAPIVVERERRRLALALAMGGLVPVVLVVAGRCEPWCVLPAWPLVALAAALAVEAAARRYVAWSRDGRAARPARVAIATVGVVLLFGASIDRLGPVPELPHPGLHAKAPPTAWGAMARAMFWEAEYPAGGRPGLLTQALWKLDERAPAVDGLARAVTSESGPADVMAGAGPIAALVAMKTGRPLALNLADDGLARLPAAELASLRARLEATRPALVLSSTHGLFQRAAFASWLRARYRVAGTFADGAGGWVYVQLRR